jgi:hypothetical protein
MHHDRTGAATDRACRGIGSQASPRVQGLGLCDALRVELAPCQIAAAIDELEERRGPLNEAYEHARTRWDEVADREREPETTKLQEELSKSAYALRVLTMLRGQLPTARHETPVILVGPASTISSIVSAAVRNVADDLAELIRERLRPTRETRPSCAMPRLP